MKRSEEPKCSIQSFLTDGIHHRQEMLNYLYLALDGIELSFLRGGILTYLLLTLSSE